MSAKDTARWDWVEKVKATVAHDGSSQPNPRRWRVHYWAEARSRYIEHEATTPQEAVDAAMKGEK